MTSPASASTSRSRMRNRLPVRSGRSADARHRPLQVGADGAAPLPARAPRAHRDRPRNRQAEAREAPAFPRSLTEPRPCQGSLRRGSGAGCAPAVSTVLGCRTALCFTFRRHSHPVSLSPSTSRAGNVTGCPGASASNFVGPSTANMHSSARGQGSCPTFTARDERFSRSGQFSCRMTSGEERRTHKRAKGRHLLGSGKCQSGWGPAQDHPVTQTCRNSCAPGSRVLLRRSSPAVL